uniref:Uncharacterized protein n=1 Tax=Oryza barthii TaxID=65489 RepID=A0A0D3HRF3_9ORYZ
WAGESVQSHDAITPAPPHPHPTVNGAAAAGDRGGPPPPERQKPTIDSPASSIARFRYPHLRRSPSPPQVVDGRGVDSQTPRLNREVDDADPARSSA